MNNEIRVLVLEDSATDAELNLRELRRAGYESKCRRVQTEAEFTAALVEPWDVILADFGLPGWDSVEALALVQSRGLDIPFIIVSGTIGEEDAVSAMRHGAADYLLKDRLARLGPAVRRALETKRLHDDKKLQAAEREAERQRVETVLRESEAHLRNLVQALPAAVYTCDAQGYITLCNDAAVSLWGRTPELGKDLWCGSWKIFQPDGSPMPLEDCPMAVALREGRAVRGAEIVVERPDGSRANVQPYPTPMRNSLGELTGAVNMLMDITERKQAEHALRISNTLYTSLVESLPQSIFRKDADGRFIFANRCFTSGLGRPLAEVLGKRDEDFFPPELAAKYRTDDLRVMATGQPFEAQEQHCDALGRTRHVQVNKSALLNDAGQVIGVQGVFLDITEKKELEAQFLRSQRMESVGALAGGIAHDLNNALAPILMAGEFLKLTVKDKAAGPLLDIIQESAQRGAGMVKQILTFARGTEGQHGLVQPRHLIEDMVEIARHTFPKGIEIRTDIAADIGTLRGNPTQLHQILLNLCVNARDAMSEGGTLTLAASNVRVDADSGLLPAGNAPGPHLLLAVTDTGAGMPPEVRARLFEAFFTTKPPGKGTGLGLSTVHNLVKEHGGFLTVDSTVGRGTTFKIYLPAETAPGAAEAAPAPPSLPLGNGDLVLVVDDEASVLRIAEQTLLAFGYRVVLANDGTQAIGVAAQNRDTLKLLLTDMAMPFMDGRATTRAIRHLLPRLPVIVASGSDEFTDAKRRKELNIQAFLAKPYSAETLLRTVHEVLHRTDER